MPPVVPNPDELSIGHSLQRLIAQLIPLIASSRSAELGIMQQCCPAPFFGKLTSATVATIALNPSRLEFQTQDGRILQGAARRLHTLESLGIQEWEEFGEAHASLVVDALLNYFDRAPYRKWFDPLDRMLRGSGSSYYSGFFPACHLDLVPFATSAKWGQMSRSDQCELLKLSSQCFLDVLRLSNVRAIVLNGISVVRGFEEKTAVKLAATEMLEWSLRRQGAERIKGVAFRGQLELPGTEHRSILVLGFNHNVQSSYGVTDSVRTCITKWIIDCFAEACT